MADLVQFTALYNPMELKSLMAIGQRADLTVTYSNDSANLLHDRKYLKVQHRDELVDEEHKWLFFRLSSAVIITLLVHKEYPSRVGYKCMDEILDTLKHKARAFELWDKKTLEKKMAKEIKHDILRKYNILEEVDVLSKAVKKSEHVIKQAEKNVEQLLDRQVNLDDLNDKGQQLLDNAHIFENRAGALKKQMKWYKNKQIIIAGSTVSSFAACWYYFM